MEMFKCFNCIISKYVRQIIATCTCSPSLPKLDHKKNWERTRQGFIRVKNSSYVSVLRQRFMLTNPKNHLVYSYFSRFAYPSIKIWLHGAFIVKLFWQNFKLLILFFTNICQYIWNFCLQIWCKLIMRQFQNGTCGMLYGWQRKGMLLQVAVTCNPKIIFTCTFCCIIIEMSSKNEKTRIFSRWKALAGKIDW